MQHPLRSLALAAAGAVLSLAASAQAAADPGRPAAVIPVASEAPAKLLVYPPVPEALARGVVILQYRTENLRVLPVFGAGALQASPRLGHLHVTVDGGPGTWAHTSGDPIIVVGLQPGTHKVVIEIAAPDHKILASETMEVVVPGSEAAAPHVHG